MKLNILKKGFNYSQDGQGNRLVYHLQGCNMGCYWCSNPESIKMSDLNACEIDELIFEVKGSRLLFFDGGGVTLTGGEPTVQFNGIKEFYIRLKEENINTAIETNGTHPDLPDLYPYIDYLIMDFKHYDSNKLKQYTNMGNEIIIQNFSKIGCKNAIIRVPLINNFNADKKDALNFAKLFSEYNTENIYFEFLPYHEYGKIKWEKNNTKYKMENAFIESCQLKLFEEIFRNNNLKTIIT